MMDSDRRPLRNIHHLWHPRAIFNEDSLTADFRNLRCSTVDIWVDAHCAIHGRPRIPGLMPGLYLPPVMPSNSVMQAFVDKHQRKVICHHPHELVTVNVFQLASTPWDTTFDEPCARVMMDAEMLDLLRQHLFRHPRANLEAHVAYLEKRHRRHKCICHFPAHVRHVRADNQKIAA